MVKSKKDKQQVFFLLLILGIIFLAINQSNKQVSVSYNYYDESGNLLGSGRESTVNGIPGVYYVRVVTNVKNTGTVPLRNISVTSASPAAVASAYSGVADVATLAAGATTTLTSALINITQFEGQTVPVSIVIDSQYTTGEGVNSTVTYSGSTSLVVTPDTASNALYVDKNNINCKNTYTKAQAANQATPWCSIQTALNNVAGGELILIKSGVYNEKSVLSYKTVSTDVIISAYNGQEVVLTGYDTKFAQANNLWTNVAPGVWKTSFTGETVMPYVYDEDESKYFVFADYAVSGGGNPLGLNQSYELFMTRGYEKATWYNVTSKELFLKYTDTSKNPNNMKLFITNLIRPLELSHSKAIGTAKIIVQNLSFKYIKEGINIVQGTNIILQNNKFYGGEYPIRMQGNDDTSFAGTSIIIRNNYMDGKFIQNVWYTEDTKYQRPMETSAILLFDYYGSALIYNNRFDACGGGIVLWADAQKEFDRSEVHDNLFFQGGSDQIEVEDYCSNSKYYNNKIYSSATAQVSLAPAYATPDAPCEFYNNEVVALGLKRVNPTHSEKAFVTKLQYRNSLTISNWNIHHNTFVAKGRAWYGLSADGSPTGYKTFTNMNVTNNIFYSEDEYIVIRTGESVDNVFFDYNLYYSTPGGYNPFARWNGDFTTVQYSSLAAAMASTSWDGKWDIHSKETNPNFASITSFNLRPSGIACTMSSTGSYVGAVPCG